MWSRTADHRPPAREQPAPSECPFCHSPAVTTTSKVPDLSAYWRCEACGEVWNLSRLETPASRYGYHRR